MKKTLRDKLKMYSLTDVFESFDPFICCDKRSFLKPTMQLILADRSSEAHILGMGQTKAMDSISAIASDSVSAVMESSPIVNDPAKDFCGNFSSPSQLKLIPSTLTKPPLVKKTMP